MKRKLSLALIIIGFLGFLTLIPGAFDNAAYIYFRAVDGNSVTLDDRCIKIPEGWVFDSKGNRSDHVIINLRKKNTSGYVFVSIIDGSSEIISRNKDEAPAKEIPGGNSIYEITGLPTDNTVRYWASLPRLNLILMGRDVAVIEELATLTWQTDC